MGEGNHFSLLYATAKGKVCVVAGTVVGCLIDTCIGRPYMHVTITKDCVSVMFFHDT